VKVRFDPTRLRDLRKGKDLTQSRLGVLLGLGRNHLVSDWETGRRKPRIESIERICDVLECEPNELFVVTVKETIQEVIRSHERGRN
jgi:transcriptional regulator with XRE-family HTH domain